MSDSNSILAADFGSVYTRVSLIDTVDGFYRLVGRAEVRSTGGFPAGDVMLGLRQAIKRIEKVTGRKLLNDVEFIITPEDENRSGVDYFVATASGGRSLRAVLVGLVPGVSIESGLRATEGTYVDVVDILSLSDNRSEEDQLNALLLTRPDLIFITGGTEKGALDPLKKMLRLVKTSLLVTRSINRPDILYAGNGAAADFVHTEFDNIAKVFIADNVRPYLDVEDIDSAKFQLGQVFDQYKESQGHGFDTVSEMSAIGLMPTAQSQGVVVEYLGKARDYKGIVAIDIGSSSSNLSTYYNGELLTSIRTDIGLGQSAPGLVRNIDADQIRSWIPFSITEADLLNYALNKSLRPSTIPATRKDLYLEHALLRSGIETMLRIQRPDWYPTAPDVDLIIGSGSALTNTGNAGITTMLLLDAIKPTGYTEIMTDPNAVIPAMGPIAYIAPEAVVHLLEGDSLERVATVFSVEGTTSIDKKVVKYRIDFEEGPPLEDVVNGEDIVFIQLEPGKTAKVHINTTARNLKIEGKRSITRTVEGSLAGIVIDTRGRPLPLGVEIKRRMIHLLWWYFRASKIEHEDLPDTDLLPVTERYPEDAELIVGGVSAKEGVDAKPARRGLFGRRKPAAAAEPVSDEILPEDIDIDALESLFENEEVDLDDLRG